MRSNFNLDGMGTFGILFGFGALAFAAWQSKKTNDMAKKLDLSIDEVEKKTSIDIEQSIVDAAIEKAVDREVKSAVSNTADKVRSDIKEDISKRVKTAVNDNLDAIDTAVANKAQELVNDIDKTSFQKKLTDKGTEILTGKFEDTLDGLVSDAKVRISRMTDTITSLANAFLPHKSYGNGSGLNFHID